MHNKIKRGAAAVVFLLLLFGCSSGNIGEWEEIILIERGSAAGFAASELNNTELYNPGEYGVLNLFDGDLTTCYAEGVSGPGIGGSIFIRMADGAKNIGFVNGYAKTPELFLKNNRIKKFNLSIYIAFLRPGYVSENSVKYTAVKMNEKRFIDLKDTFTHQTVKIPYTPREIESFRQKALKMFNDNYNSPIEKIDVIVGLEIADIYKGEKWDDSCISEIWFSGGIADSMPEFQDPFWPITNVTAVYTDDDGNLFIDTDKKRGITAAKDKNNILQILEISPDNQWVICAVVPKEAGEGRVETAYRIYNTFLRAAADNKLIGENASEFYGFHNEGGNSYLRYFDSSLREESAIDLKILYGRMVNNQR